MIRPDYPINRSTGGACRTLRARSGRCAGAAPVGGSRHPPGVSVGPQLGGCHRSASGQCAAQLGIDWTAVFGGAAPVVSPEEAFGAVLLYPDDEREIGELPTQPFVADYLQDLIEQDRPLAAQVGRAGQQLISGFDAAITTCIAKRLPPRLHRALRPPGFRAAAGADVMEPVGPRTTTGLALPCTHDRVRANERGDLNNGPYDLAYEWTPFSHYDKPDAVVGQDAATCPAASCPARLRSFVGPATVADGCRSAGMQVQAITPVASLPTFRMHQSVLPRAQLKPGMSCSFRLLDPDGREETGGLTYPAKSSLSMRDGMVGRIGLQ
jgi:hypothetical protein